MKKNSFTIQDDTLFCEKGLHGVAGFCFHHNNLIIGENGSGKTRFLKALEKHFKENEVADVQVVTLYFPEINAAYSYSETEDLDTEESEDEVSLYDAIFSDSHLDFQDFLKLAERNGMSFLEDVYNGLNIRAKTAKRHWHEDFEKLNGLLEKLIGRTLQEKKENGEIIIRQKSNDGRVLKLVDYFNELSPGELMLFYLCMFLFYLEHVNGKKVKVVLLIDEPELHLHPKALLDVINGITSFEVVSQIYIASHSLFLLPRFAFEELIYLKQGEIQRLNSHTYKNLYDDLVGLDNFDMYDLLCSVENWENYQFIVENFLLPQVKDKVNGSDEQVQQLLQALHNKQKEHPLNVLDYGAGKCRIWECIKLAIPDATDRENLIDYEAYDPYPCKPDERTENVSYHVNITRLKSNSYDVVILMNVLHEIDPKQWRETFQNIHNILKNDGVLIFLEVLSLTNGEQPYGQAGYMLLRDQQVSELFPHAEKTHLPDSHTSEKSNCWVIPKRDLIGIDAATILKAIRSLELTCERILEKLDKERVKMAHSDFKQVDMAKRKKTARQYAFLAQQYINAHIAYKSLMHGSSINVPSNSIKVPSFLIKESETSQKITFPGLATDV